MAIRKPQRTAPERKVGTPRAEPPRKVWTASLESGARLALPDWVASLMQLGDGSEVELELSMDGLTIRPVVDGRDPGQWWFWTSEWQKGERAADAERDGGLAPTRQSADEFRRLLESVGGEAE
ncbi:MAG: hypothetical protein IH609_09845 [Dehalococcoidia bacterium]|nr:hypothetical protein [Dehalococcoidia bacterium]